MFSVVQKAVRRTLTELAPIPQVGIGGNDRRRSCAGCGVAGRRTGAILTLLGGPSWSERREALLGVGQHRLFTSAGLIHQESGSRGQESGVRNQEPASSDQLPVTSFQPSLPPPPPPRLRTARRDPFVAEGPDGMYLIDQHAAHERVLDEQMLAEHETNRLALQPLLEPLLLDFSPEQAAVVAEELENLNHLGSRSSRSAAPATWCAPSLQSWAARIPAPRRLRSSTGWRSATMWWKRRGRRAW